MSKRNTHVPKTKAHQTAYRRYIEKLDYEPTVDERLNFQQTNQAAEIVSEKLTNRKRPSTVVDEVKLHMSNIGVQVRVS